MPAKSAKQERFMRAVAHNPSFSKKVGVPMSVGREFTKAGGGMANTSRMNRLEQLGRVDAEKAFTPKGKRNLAAEKKRVVGELTGMKKGGEMKESKAMVKKEVSFMKKKGAPKSMIKHEMAEAGMKYGGKVKKMAGGGLAAGHKSADGVAIKGKTKGKEIVMKGAGKGMKKGGYC